MLNLLVDGDQAAAAFNAEPISRPLVERSGYREYSRAYIYGWMPIIDMDVIKSLVPQ